MIAHRVCSVIPGTRHSVTFSMLCLTRWSISTEFAPSGIAPSYILSARLKNDKAPFFVVMAAFLQQQSK